MRTQRISPGKFTGMISVRSPLNYEESSRYVMVVVAEDSAKEPSTVLSSTATLTIDVRDVQDQAPVFLNAPYRTIMRENSPAGQPLVKILARDGDTGQPRELQLEIVDDDLGYFRIGSFKMNDDIATATIVTSDTPIDRENEAILRHGGVYTFGLKVVFDFIFFKTSRPHDLIFFCLTGH